MHKMDVHYLLIDYEMPNQIYHQMFCLLLHKMLHGDSNSMIINDKTTRRNYQTLSITTCNASYNGHTNVTEKHENIFWTTHTNEETSNKSNNIKTETKYHATALSCELSLGVCTPHCSGTTKH